MYVGGKGGWECWDKVLKTDMVLLVFVVVMLQVEMDAVILELSGRKWRHLSVTPTVSGLKVVLKSC